MSRVNQLKNHLIDELIAREGGYVNHPEDRGGETRWGITQQVARQQGYKGEMKNLPFELAFHVYANRYWAPLQLDTIAALCPPLAWQLFDFGVNSGVSRAAKVLQELLNLLNNRGRLYPDIAVDGCLGSRSLQMLQAFAHQRGALGLRVLTECVRSRRIAFCLNIALNDERQECFEYGWLRRAVELGEDFVDEIGEAV